MFKLPLCLAFFIYFSAQSQLPLNCFEIESILVDACGNPEGVNEMVRLRTGSDSLYLSDLSVDWPNNSFQGICQNSNTANAVALLNNSVEKCGIILEPTVAIPPGAKVILFTSEDVDVSANAFTNLTDTIYAVFQCSGNTLGHFANYNSAAGLRTLVISFGALCSDTVSYERSSLVNQNGTLGGTTDEKNGARVEFSWNGLPSYVNYGCNAPYMEETVDAVSTADVCFSDSIALSAVASDLRNYFWFGGSGIFENADSLNALYLAGVGDTLDFELYFGMLGVCGDSILDTVKVTYLHEPQIFSGVDSLCSNELTYVGLNYSQNQLWNTNETTDTIFTGPGIYAVQSSNECGVFDLEVTVYAKADPFVAISQSGSDTLCEGNSLSISASGDFLNWNTGSANTQLTASSSGMYFAIGGNICGTINSDTLRLFYDEIPIAWQQESELCTGDSTWIGISGNGSVEWSSGSGADSLYVPFGSYQVTVSNACGITSLDIAIDSLSLPQLVTSNVGTLYICQNDFTFNSAYGDFYIWNTGALSNEIQIQDEGFYFAIAQNTCGTIYSDTLFVIHDYSLCPTYELPEQYIILPNVITLNGDAINDVFKIVDYLNVKEIKGGIANRWGEVLYNWQALDDRWDGRTMAGVEVSEGVYFYYFTVVYQNATSEKLTGSFHVIK